MLLTAETYALRLTNSVGRRNPTDGVHIFNRRSSSSVVSLHAEDTKSYFLTYSLDYKMEKKIYVREHERIGFVS